MQSVHQLHCIGCLKIDTTRVYEQTIESQVSDNLYLTYNLLDDIQLNKSAEIITQHINMIQCLVC